MGQFIVAKHLFIPDEWKQWIALNLLLGQSHPSLLQILINKGFSEDLSRLEIETAASQPYLAAAQTLARQRAKRDWLMHTWRKLESESLQPAIERRSKIGADEFVSEYYSRNRPLIIRDVIRRWPALAKWNRQYLIDLVGDCDIELQTNQSSEARYKANSLPTRRTVRFSAFLEVAFNVLPTEEFLLLDNECEAIAPIWSDVDGLPEYLEPNQRRGRVFFRLEPAGIVASLRHDLANQFIAQVTGRRRVKLISPSHLPVIYNDWHCFSPINLDAIDFASYPDFRHARIEEVVLEAGDLFFLPVGWWHFVVGLETNITLTFTNFRKDNDFGMFYTTYGAL